MFRMRFRSRLTQLAAGIGLIVAIVPGATSAPVHAADDEPTASEAETAPEERMTFSERSARRKQRREQREQERALREQQEATDPLLIAEARLAVTESLLTGMLDDMRRTQRQKEVITPESMLNAASVRLNNQLRHRPEAVAGPTHFLLARMLSRAELKESAEAHLLKAMEALHAVGDHEEYSSARDWLASILRTSGRVEEALEIYKTNYDAAEKKDDRNRAISFMIECNELLGRYADAAALYPHIITPPNPNARSDFGRHGSPYTTRARFGLALLEAGDLDEAERVLRGALKTALETRHQESSSVLAMNAAVGLTLSLQGREEEHEIQRSQIIAGARFFAAMNHLEDWEWIGRYLAHVGEYELAIWYLENGTARVPEKDQHGAEYQGNLALLEEVRAAVVQSPASPR